jgi:nucleotide-binding universal stress UspA family protein
MFKHIIWATDGSKSADRALPFVKSVAQDGGTVVVLHCDEFLVGRGGGQPVIADEEDVKAKIERQARELKDDGLDVSLNVVGATAGSVAQKIAAAASQGGADLIVVGTRGHTVLGGLLLGGVTQRLLHIAPCPVLTIPAGQETAKAAEPAHAEAVS